MEAASGTRKVRLNNRYKITIQDPLCRPGLSIDTEVSERYVVEAIRRMMAMIREVNKPEEENK